jgi:hypothetical protein
VTAMRGLVSGRVILGGHSYGGRQASMLAAEDGAIADALLLLSYPLHPPEKLRTEHFGRLHTPTLFVQGAKRPIRNRGGHAGCADIDSGSGGTRDG